MEYPQAVEDRIPEHWGKQIHIGNGWYGLVSELDRNLAKIDPHYEVQQVKQKFAELRFYFSPSDGVSDEDREEMYDLVNEAESRSSYTCETCGEPGEVKSLPTGFVYVACEDHVVVPEDPFEV